MLLASLIAALDARCPSRSSCMPLFEDRVLLWRALGAGGWRRAGSQVAAAPRVRLKRYFVWSKPLEARRQ